MSEKIILYRIIIFKIKSIPILFDNDYFRINPFQTNYQSLRL